MAELLGQQEILEAEPRRRVVVPRGAVNWWGVDPNTSRCVIATVTPDGLRGWEEIPFEDGLKGLARLSDIRLRVQRAALDLAVIVPPGFINLERMVAPKGRPLNVELHDAVAVTYCAIFDGVSTALGGRMAAHDMMVPGTWKRIACGNGAIHKPKKLRGQPAPRPEEYGVLRWAWENGLPRSVVSWDVCDAWGLAEAGRRDVMLDAR